MVAVSFGCVGISAAAPATSLPVDQAYEKYVETQLTSMGTWEGWGFRAAGSTADNQASIFVEKEMKSIGLTNVRREAVPVDAWDFKGGSVTVAGASGTQTFLASSMGGVPGTPPGGLTGEIVYVGRGTPQEYPAAGIAGKLLLCDWDADYFWVNLVANQATVDGALGVIVSTMNHPVYYAWPDSLGSFDATYNDDWVPLVVISRDDGFSLMNMMAQGPVTGTMVSTARLTVGGTGYNTIGVYPGKDHQHPIIMIGHHDAWFTGASDDTSSVAAMLAWAKAMKKAGFVPQHDIYLVSDTGEEYGNTDAYYEWLVGAWYMITQAHPDWAEKAIAFVNLEGIGGRWFDGTLGQFVATANYELAPLARQIFAANSKSLPGGWAVDTVLGSWTDGWTLTAAGVPGVTFSQRIPGYDAIYHTNMDNIALIHYDDMAREINVMHKFLVALDSAAVLPYRFYERATSMALSVDPNDYNFIGVDASALNAAVQEFKFLAMKYDKVAGKFTAKERAEANSLLMQVDQIINTEWNALSCWDDTIYPTEQVEWDAGWMTKAIAFLQSGNLNSAINELWNVGLTWNSFFDYQVWKYENDRHAPGALNLNWGGQGHLAPYVDIYGAFVSLREKAAAGGQQDVSWEISELQKVVDSEKLELEKRAALEASQVLQVNNLLNELIVLATT